MPGGVAVPKWVAYRGPSVRGYVLAEAARTRDMYECLPAVYAQFDKPCQRLEGGLAADLYRFELPPDHPQAPNRRPGLAPCDLVLLTETDEVIEHEHTMRGSAL